MTHAWLRCCVLCVVSGAASIVRAGPLEQFVQVLSRDEQPQRIAVRYEQSGGGLLVSDDGGASFALVCAGAFSPEQPSAAAMDGEGRISVASFTGMVRDDGAACGWTEDATLRGRWVTDVVAHPDQPDVTFAVASLGDPPESGVYRSRAGGSFELVGKLDAARVTRLRVVPRPGGVRLYESVVRGARQVGAGSVADYAVRYSDDLAETWTEHAFPQIDGTLRLEAIDPSDQRRIVVSVSSPRTGATLHVSRDAGATFEPYLELAGFGGVSITPEGRVYIGDAGDPTGVRRTRGLYRASSLAAPATRLTDAYSVRCLGYRNSDATLFACDSYRFGIADLDTGELRPLVRFNAVERFVECPGVDVRSRCEVPMRAGYCGLTHFPCAPICDAYQVDLTDLPADPSFEACFARRGPVVQDAGVVAAPQAAEDAAAPRLEQSDAGGARAHPVGWGCQLAAVGGAAPLHGGIGSLLVAAAWVALSRRRRRSGTAQTSSRTPTPSTRPW